MIVRKRESFKSLFKNLIKSHKASVTVWTSFINTIILQRPLFKTFQQQQDDLIKTLIRRVKNRKMIGAGGLGSQSPQKNESSFLEYSKFKK